jgi:hypothetical protein
MGRPLLQEDALNTIGKALLVLTISNFEKFEWLRDQLKKEGFHLSLPGGN